jgi:hypothetical protein
MSLEHASNPYPEKSAYGRKNSQNHPANMTNPCHSPSVPNTPAQPPAPRSRWRFVLAIAMFVYGALAVILGVTGFLCHLPPDSRGMKAWNGARWAAITDSQIYVILFLATLIGLHGCFVIAAGRFLLAGRWRQWIIAVTGAAFLLSLVCVIEYCIWEFGF